MSGPSWRRFLLSAIALTSLIPTWGCAHRGSPLRATALEPHCIPCAQVVVGPIDGLVGAAFDGLIEVTDPFRELWTHRQFDPGRLAEDGEGAESRWRPPQRGSQGMSKSTW